MLIKFILGVHTHTKSNIEMDSEKYFTHKTEILCKVPDTSLQYSEQNGEKVQNQAKNKKGDAILS